MLKNLAIICGLMLSAATAFADEWADTCRLSATFGVSCQGIAPPPIVDVRFTDQRSDQTVDAVVRHGGILVRESLPEGTDRSAVIVHEMVHYLLDKTRLIPLNVTQEQNCRSEGYAYAVSNQYLAEKNRKDLANPRWWRLYRGCRSTHGDVTGFSDSN